MKACAAVAVAAKKNLTSGELAAGGNGGGQSGAKIRFKNYQAQQDFSLVPSRRLHFRGKSIDFI